MEDKREPNKQPNYLKPQIAYYGQTWQHRFTNIPELFTDIFSSTQDQTHTDIFLGLSGYEQEAEGEARNKMYSH